MVGDSVDYRVPAWGLSLAASGPRGLLLIDTGDFKASGGAAGSMRLDPGTPDRGLAKAPARAGTRCRRSRPTARRAIKNGREELPIQAVGTPGTLPPPLSVLRRAGACGRSSPPGESDDGTYTALPPWKAANTKLPRAVAPL